MAGSIYHSMSVLDGRLLAKRLLHQMAWERGLAGAGIGGNAGMAGCQSVNLQLVQGVQGEQVVQGVQGGE